MLQLPYPSMGEVCYIGPIILWWLSYYVFIPTYSTGGKSYVLNDRLLPMRAASIPGLHSPSEEEDIPSSSDYIRLVDKVVQQHYVAYKYSRPSHIQTPWDQIW